MVPAGSIKKITAIILDKTGTITEGKPAVTNIIWLNNDSSTFSALVSLERQSEHPLAEAVVKHFYEQNYLPVHDFESITGSGARAKIGDQIYYAGNASLFKTRSVPIAADLSNVAANWISQAKTVIYFGDSKQALAVIAIADKLKGTSIEAVKQIQEMGVAVYMLTGDNNATATVIAKQAGIKDIKAEVLPIQKAEFIKQLQEQGNIVVVVGDGINASNTLAQANVSIAMGKGTDSAMDVAKMTIISSDFSKTPEAVKLSRYAIAAILQNLFWAFIYNIIGIPIAADILYSVKKMEQCPYHLKLCYTMMQNFQSKNKTLVVQWAARIIDSLETN